MKYIILLFMIACAAPRPKLSKPRTPREAHVFKYTDMAIEAQLNGRTDSVDYYLNLALKYDSIYPNIKKRL